MVRDERRGQRVRPGPGSKTRLSKQSPTIIHDMSCRPAEPRLSMRLPPSLRHFDCDAILLDKRFHSFRRAVAVHVVYPLRPACRTVGPSPHPLSLENPWSNFPGKRNTSRPVFTAHERSLAKSAWSASSARLNRDSFLPFGSCSLCLESAVDPVACVLGDIFCRECALNNILAQKKEIKRLEKTRENEERDAAEDKARQDQEAQAKAVKEFELVQAGFDVVETGETRTREKRKAPVDEDELGGQQERAKARKSNGDDKVGLSSMEFVD